MEVFQSNLGFKACFVIIILDQLGFLICEEGLTWRMNKRFNVFLALDWERATPQVQEVPMFLAFEVTSELLVLCGTCLKG